MNNKKNGGKHIIVQKQIENLPEDLNQLHLEIIFNQFTLNQ